MTDDQILDGVIEREGGYADDPLDAGGPTKFGITQATLALWKGHPVTSEDVRQLSVAEAREIYRQRYIMAPGFGAIEDDRLRSLVVDSAVNHGVAGATVLLQKALGVKEDAIFGPQTRAALKASTPGQLWLFLFGERLVKYGGIITKNPSQAKFALGWMNRMKGLLDDFAGG